MMVCRVHDIISVDFGDQISEENALLQYFKHLHKIFRIVICKYH
jgi:hypothetical protein